MKYAYVTEKMWNIRDFQVLVSQRPKEETWHLITQKKLLNPEHLRVLGISKVFVPHWSHMIPAEIHNEFECVVFHMTDLPFGRGGSPLQNLIKLGLSDTKLTALRVTEQLDAGPVYRKKDLSLAGSAQEIFERCSQLVLSLIGEILDESISPTEQRRKVEVFSRRTPEQSSLLGLSRFDELFDHIRMLDAEGYPHAYIDTDISRIEFVEARRTSTGELEAKAIFKRKSP
jgi:methionyl-tRNA formyltransferase